MNYMPSPEQIDFMTHSMGPIVGKVNQQKQTKPMKPGLLQGEEGKTLKQNLVNANAEEFEKKARKLGDRTTTKVGNGIRKPVEFFMRNPLNDQFNPDEDEKNRDG